MQLTHRQRSTLWGWAVGLGIVLVVAAGGIFLVRAEEADYNRANQRCENAGGIYVDFGDDEICMTREFVVPTEAP